MASTSRSKTAPSWCCSGPSGCGKSTLAPLHCGSLKTITSVDIEIGGRRVNDVHPKDRDIAMVFQNYALYAHMNVRRNMSFSMTLAKRPQSEIDEKKPPGPRRSSIWNPIWRVIRESCQAAEPARGHGPCHRAQSGRVPVDERFPTSMRSCACKCAPKSRTCMSAE